MARHGRQVGETGWKQIWLRGCVAHAGIDFRRRHESLVGGKGLATGALTKIDQRCNDSNVGSSCCFVPARSAKMRANPPVSLW